MLFNSLDFAIFLPIVFALYWAFFQRSVRWRNIYLIAAGCVFYGWWDPRFLVLWIFTAGVDYLVALRLQTAERPGLRKGLMAISLTANLGLLGFFKYYDFFVQSFAEAFTLLGVHLDVQPLRIILPVGISFYTFQSLSYTFDVYRRQLDAIRRPEDFFAFVSFFPQMLAGPIERARHMLPQFSRPARFDHDQAMEGMELMVWGFFKKVVIADNCSHFVGRLFDDAHFASLHGGLYVLGAALFAFQIYCDFSGYSDIAIGCARLFGFQLMRNFAYPYFSRDIAEFWRRWHISLTTWFRDYVYIPLGGNRSGRWRTVRNVAIVFLVSGLWHGANKTFIAWGAYHAALFLPLVLTSAHRKHLDAPAGDRLLPGVADLLRMLATFALACIGWVLFRARTLHHALAYFKRMLMNWHGRPFDMTSLDQQNSVTLFVLLLLIGFFLAVEWSGRRRLCPLSFRAPYRLHRWFQLGVVLLMLLYGEFNQTEFIYFQF